MHVGLIKQADGGTLFLDETGELPMSIQNAFLRVLQERRFRLRAFIIELPPLRQRREDIGELASAHHNPTLFPRHLPTSFRVHVPRASVSQRSSVSQEDQSKLSSKVGVDPSQVPATLQDFRQSAIVEAEKQYLRNLMPLTRGNIKEACRISGLSRPRLYALMKKHQISRLV